MATILGVVPLAANTPGLMEKLAPLDVRAVGGAPSTSRTFIEVDGWSQQEAEDLATRISKSLGIEVLSVLGQTSADVYSVAEFAKGALVRRVSFNRDADGWKDGFEGMARGWETDLHFAAPLDDFLDALSEDGATEADLANVRHAYGTRAVAQLPTLPQPSGTSLHAFLAALGADVGGGPHARYKRPGLIARLFGR